MKHVGQVLLLAPKTEMLYYITVITAIFSSIISISCIDLATLCNMNSKGCLSFFPLITIFTNPLLLLCRSFMDIANVNFQIIFVWHDFSTVDTGEIAWNSSSFYKEQKARKNQHLHPCDNHTYVFLKHF